MDLREFQSLLQQFPLMKRGEPAGGSIAQIKTYPENANMDVAVSLDKDDFVALVDCSVWARTVNLPPAANGPQLLMIVNSTGANTATIQPASGDTIGGLASKGLTTLGSYAIIASDAKTDWKLFSSHVGLTDLSWVLSGHTGANYWADACFNNIGASYLKKNNYSATVDPTINDDITQNYSIGSIWINLTGRRVFIARGVSAGNAIWIRLDEVSTIGVTFDGGGGNVILSGTLCYLYIPFNCTITAWTILPDVSGSIVVDVWRKAYGSFPPTNADSITNGHEPTLTATTKAQDLDLSDWTSVLLLAGDTLAFNVDSATTVSRVNLTLEITKT